MCKYYKGKKCKVRPPSHQPSRDERTMYCEGNYKSCTYINSHGATARDGFNASGQRRNAERTGNTMRAIAPVVGIAVFALSLYLGMDLFASLGVAAVVAILLAAFNKWH